MTHEIALTVLAEPIAQLLVQKLRNHGFHPEPIDVSAHRTIAGVSIDYPIRVPVNEVDTVREFLASTQAEVP